MPGPLRCFLGFCMALVVLGQTFEESGQADMPRPTKKAGFGARKRANQNNLKEANGPTSPPHQPRAHLQQQLKIGDVGCLCIFFS